MSIFSDFSYKDDYFKDKIVVFNQNSGLSETHKQQKIFFIVDWILKFFRNLIRPESRIGNVVKGFEAEKIETKSVNEILNYLKYTLLFREKVIQKHNRSLWPCESPVDTTTLDQKRTAVAKDLFKEERDTRTADGIRDYLLTGNIALNVDSIFKIAEMAQKYQISSLINVCDDKMQEFVGENLSVPVTPDKIRWMLKVDRCKLEKTKQRIIAFWEDPKYKASYLSSLASPANDLQNMFSVNVELCAELARRYPCESISQACTQAFLKMHEKINYQGSYLNLLPNDGRTWVVADDDQNKEYFVQAVKVEVSNEQIALEGALKLGFKDAAKQIYDSILMRASVVTVEYHSKFLEEHREQPQTHDAMNARVKVLGAHAQQMAALYPTDERFSHLNQLFQKSYAENEKSRLFIYVLGPYFLEHYEFCSRVMCRDLSTLEVLDLIKQAKDFSKETKNPKLQKFVTIGSNDCYYFFHFAIQELHKPLGEENKQRLIERVRKEFYPQISTDLLECTVSRASSAMDFEKLTHIDLEKTEYNNEKTSDVTLKLPDGTKLYLHKSVLKRSPYFDRMIQGLFKEAFQKEIEIKDLTDDEIPIFIDLIKYLYTNKLEIDENNGCIIIPLAAQFQIEPLLYITCLWQEWAKNVLKKKSSSSDTEIAFSPDAYVSCVQSATQVGLKEAAAKFVGKLLNTICEYVDLKELFEKDNITYFTRKAELPLSEEQYREHTNALGKVGEHLLDYYGYLPSSMLPTVTKSCPNLKYLTLTRTDLAINGENAFELSKLKQLTYFSIKYYNTKVDVNGLEKLITFCPHLKKLDISFVTTVNTDFQKFKDFISHFRPDLQLKLNVNDDGKEKTGTLHLSPKGK